uniref:Interleukin 12A n=1 Tax=Mastacembelus armatus TaxID=205130 RepID=A0A3Q3LW67_9TELE
FGVKMLLYYEGSPYFAPALLLLVLSCPLWHVSQAVPVMSKGQMTDSCVLYARTLLQNITDALAQRNLFSGIDCKEQSMQLNTKSNTPSVCAPKESTCSGNTVSEFNLVGCYSVLLCNLTQTLQVYFIAVINPSSWLSRLLKVAADGQCTYDERLSLCKILKGFQVRTITINRVIGYLNSGEH